VVFLRRGAGSGKKKMQTGGTRMWPGKSPIWRKTIKKTAIGVSGYKKKEVAHGRAKTSKTKNIWVKAAMRGSPLLNR